MGLYEQYVELMKRAVSGYLYLDMDRDARIFDRAAGDWMDPKSQDRQKRELARQEGSEWPGIAYSMCGFKRLENLEYCLRTAVTNKVPGGFIETGVWRGGACIFATAVLRALGERDRTVWVADSFQGLPPPDRNTYPADRGCKLHTEDYLRVSRKDVERAFELFGLLDGNVRFLEGFFEKTLDTPLIDKLCVARLDGDMYSSTISALDALYKKISPGGFLIVDDYGLKPCKSAVDDFRKAHGIDAPMQICDWTGVFWQVA
jgi:O-methyltransferase